MSALIPSPHVPGEFIPMDTQPHAVDLATAIGAHRYSGAPHLTPARALKYAALLDAGFVAVRGETGWRYQRGGGRLVTLPDAIMCVEVMR